VREVTAPARGPAGRWYLYRSDAGLAAMALILLAAAAPNSLQQSLLFECRQVVGGRIAQSVRTAAGPAQVRTELCKR